MIYSLTFGLCDQKLMAFDKHDRLQAEHAPEGPTKFIGTLWEMTYAMREQATTTHQMMKQICKRLKRRPLRQSQ